MLASYQEFLNFDGCGLLFIVGLRDLEELHYFVSPKVFVILEWLLLKQRTGCGKFFLFPKHTAFEPLHLVLNIIIVAVRSQVLLKIKFLHIAKVLHCLFSRLLHLKKFLCVFINRNLLFW